MTRLTTFFLTLLFTATAFAQEAPTEATGIVALLRDSFKGGNWHLFASAVIMALVWLVTKAPGLSGLIKGKAKIWVAAVAGMLSAVAVTAFTTNGDWLLAIGNGFAVGLSATGLFELISRHVAKKPIDSDNDGVLDPLK